MALKTCHQKSLLTCVISQHTLATKQAHKHLFFSGLPSADGSGARGQGMLSNECSGSSARDQSLEADCLGGGDAISFEKGFEKFLSSMDAVGWVRLKL